MKFFVDMNCDNAAFGTGEAGDAHQEVARLLRQAANEVELGAYTVVLRDINGNKVGTAFFAENES
jgi:hypothetical protein